MNPKDADWDRVEFEYRRNVLSLREIADPHGISETAIRKRAKKYGWVRDINSKVQQKARIIAAKQVADHKADTEAELIEITAIGVAEVMVSHKKGINRMRDLCDKLTNELEAQGEITEDDLKAMAEVSQMVAGGDMSEADAGDLERAISTFRKVLGLGSRVDTFKKLVESQVKLIDAERAAHGITGEEKSHDPLADFLNALDGRTASLAKQ